MAFSPEHPKWDQNPKFTPLGETTSIPTPFCESKPRGWKDTSNVHTLSCAYTDRVMKTLGGLENIVKPRIPLGCASSNWKPSALQPISYFKEWTQNWPWKKIGTEMFLKFGVYSACTDFSIRIEFIYLLFFNSWQPSLMTCVAQWFLVSQLTPEWPISIFLSRLLFVDLLHITLFLTHGFGNIRRLLQQQWKVIVPPLRFHLQSYWWATLCNKVNRNTGVAFCFIHILKRLDHLVSHTKRHYRNVFDNFNGSSVGFHLQS